MDFQGIPCEMETLTDDHLSLCHEISGLQTSSHHGDGADKKKLPVVLVTFGAQKKLVDMRILYNYCALVDMTSDNHSYRAYFRMAVAPLGAVEGVFMNHVCGPEGNEWSSRTGHVDGFGLRRGTERPAAGRRRSSEVLGAAVAARPAWSWWRARPTGVGSALAVLVAVLALGAAAPAQAQTEITLVSNLAQDREVGENPGVSSSTDLYAQGFETGGNTAGYTLTEVTVNVGDIFSSGFPVMRVCPSDEDSNPTGDSDTTDEPDVGSSDCATLSNPASFETGEQTFASSDVVLDPGATYFVVAGATTSVDYSLTTTNSNDEDAGGANGWSILGSSYESDDSGSSWTGNTVSMRMKLKGTVNAVDRDAIPADWSLKPDAVGADGRFRLLFVSSTTRTGDSTDIADYNAHVQTAAAAGHADIQAFAADFTAGRQHRGPSTSGSTP